MACWLWNVPCAAKRTSAARSPRPPATWASALVSHLTAREALADHLRILEHRREGAAIGGPPARRRGGKSDARPRPHHLRRPPRPSGSERRGARGRGSRWRRAPNARSAKEAFALGRGDRHRGRGRRGGGSTCEKVVPGVLRPTRCLAASAIAQKGRKRSGVAAAAPAPGHSLPASSPEMCRIWVESRSIWVESGSFATAPSGTERRRLGLFQLGISFCNLAPEKSIREPP